MFDSINPANGSVLAEVSRGDAADIDVAVASSLKTFKSGAWSRLAPRARMAIMLRFADLIEQHASDFALIDTLDMGKPITEMLTGRCAAGRQLLPLYRRMHRQDAGHGWCDQS